MFTLCTLKISFSIKTNYANIIFVISIKTDKDLNDYKKNLSGENKNKAKQNVIDNKKMFFT